MKIIGVDVYNLTTTGSVGRTITTNSGGLNEHIPLVIELEEETNPIDIGVLTGYNDLVKVNKE